MNEKLSITLPSEMVAAIKSRVDAGAYASTSEVLRAAMRVWLREEAEYEERIAAIRARVRLRWMIRGPISASKKWMNGSIP